MWFCGWANRIVRGEEIILCVKKKLKRMWDDFSLSIIMNWLYDGLLIWHSSPILLESANYWCGNCEKLTYNQISMMLCRLFSILSHHWAFLGITVRLTSNLVQGERDNFSRRWAIPQKLYFLIKIITNMLHLKCLNISRGF